MDAGRDRRCRSIMFGCHGHRASCCAIWCPGATHPKPTTGRSEHCRSTWPGPSPRDRRPGSEQGKVFVFCRAGAQILFSTSTLGCKLGVFEVSFSPSIVLWGPKCLALSGFASGGTGAVDGMVEAWTGGHPLGWWSDLFPVSSGVSDRFGCRFGHDKTCDAIVKRLTWNSAVLTITLSLQPPETIVAKPQLIQTIRLINL